MICRAGEHYTIVRAHDVVARLACRRCGFSVSRDEVSGANAPGWTGVRSGLPRYNRMRAAMVRHVHTQHPDDAGQVVPARVPETRIPTPTGREIRTAVDALPPGGEYHHDVVPGARVSVVRHDGPRSGRWFRVALTIGSPGSPARPVTMEKHNCGTSDSAARMARQLLTAAAAYGRSRTRARTSLSAEVPVCEDGGHAQARDQQAPAAEGVCPRPHDRRPLPRRGRSP